MKGKVAIERAADITPETVVHRVGGGNADNLRLSILEEKLMPPGISILLGGTPQQVATQMRQAFPRSRKWRRTAHTVGTTTAAALRQAGFEIVPDSTPRFPNHARLTHLNGVAGFTNANPERLAQTFRDTRGC